ncbi:hypothetical protein [Flavobacterium selenitireducens]|uniref:hypothetical protein n=1 Tax=Flavobacterium selenitireducens TaxID=2722704 RepID=UPI00168B6C21|nr:hypothetical protein [Flavobacterium selenitireducens]MBD3584091.1 hypothetical protein [Flavobacterium selenitireducens]
MEINKILQRLRATSFKSTEARLIASELKRLPQNERDQVVAILRNEKTKSDNSDLLNVIDEIINELNPR